MEGKITGVRYGEVIDNYDVSGAGRISVKLSPEDDSKDPSTLEVDAVPLMPKMFYVRPKIGEGVFVLLSTNNNGDSQRHYIGPVISQPHKMYREDAFEGGDTYQKGSPKDYDPNPYNDPDSFGAYQDGNDVAVMGRKNCDIIIKDDDIRIRAGVKVVNDESKYSVRFNEKNPAFIKLKYHEKELDGDNKSTVAVVADKIALMSNKSDKIGIADETNNFGLRNDLITDDQMNNILQQAYRLPYGEILVDLLKQMIAVFCAHTHDYACMPPNAFFVNEMKMLNNMYLSDTDKPKPDILSDTVRIN